MLDRGRRLDLFPTGADERAVARSILERVEVGAEHVRMFWRTERRSPAPDETRLAQGDLLTLERDRIVLEVNARVQARGGSRSFRGPAGHSAIVTPAHDPVLVKALVRAESWRRNLVSSEAPTIDALAKVDGVNPDYARRMLRLAFLAPDLKHAILDGQAPAGLTLQRVMTQGLPDSWAEQRRFVAA